MSDEPKITDTVSPTPTPDQLSDADLDVVAGGINPQPLPPMPRRNQ